MSSGSLLLDVVFHNLNLPLQQICSLTCASASTSRMLRQSLHHRSITYPVTFKADDVKEIEQFTAW